MLVIQYMEAVKASKGAGWGQTLDHRGGSLFLMSRRLIYSIFYLRFKYLINIALAAVIIMSYCG